uniref:Uncharacterized protein n=1 Tax=Meloidogyne enterolobii TaxID=390850 RepID=A0A6V7W6W4_MELEN|nr:unnamed protein product [Meloidogyne enterolobii]
MDREACDLRTTTRRADNHHSPSLEFSSLRDGVSDGKVILETTTLLIIRYLLDYFIISFAFLSEKFG